MTFPRRSLTTMNCLGATYLENDRCQFVVWAPFAGRVDVRIVRSQEAASRGAPRSVAQNGPDRLIPLERAERGYHWGVADGVQPGAL